jgi:molecular chaperone DnaK (HSP70)
MATIGIDLGSKKAIIGVVRGSGIDIVLNDASNRNTDVLVAYTPEERLVGGAVNA